MSVMQWSQLLAPIRIGDPHNDRHGELGRTPFHKDHDRIVFSGSFRRLGRKTQVHPLAENDHIHTRLSHSLEVGSVGRSLGMMVGEGLKDNLPDFITPADLGVIVQAACLGHDIGNPPFGHAGEYAIRDWFRAARVQTPALFESLAPPQIEDLLTYEGNAQGFRIVTQIEYNQFNGGMRLTASTLGALLKYPWTVEYAIKGGKFGAYQTEKSLLGDVADVLGLLQRSPGVSAWCRHPLAYLVEAADDICYALLDLEDGMEMDILRFDEVAEILGQIAGLAKDDPVWDEFRQMEASGVSRRRRIAALRGMAMERAVGEVADAFIANEKTLLLGEMQDDLLAYCHTDLSEGVQRAKDIARQQIFKNARKAKLEIGAYTTLGTLLQDFIGAAYELRSTGQTNYKHQRVLALIGENTPLASWDLYASYRRMLDFIGGMTDHYAVDLAQEMGGRLQGS